MNARQTRTQKGTRLENGVEYVFVSSLLNWVNDRLAKAVLKKASALAGGQE